MREHLLVKFIWQSFVVYSQYLQLLPSDSGLLCSSYLLHLPLLTIDYYYSVLRHVSLRRIPAHLLNSAIYLGWHFVILVCHLLGGALRKHCWQGIVWKLNKFCCVLIRVCFVNTRDVISQPLAVLWRHDVGTMHLEELYLTSCVTINVVHSFISRINGSMLI